MIPEEKIVDYIRAAAADVFSTMLGLEIKTGTPYMDERAPTVSDGVLAVVSMAGNWTGAGVISCSAEFACRVCNLLLMTEAAAVDEEVLDAVGEVANMIVGNFKTMVEEHAGPLALSIPTVIFGKNFTSRSLGTASWVVVPIEFQQESIELRACLAVSKDPIAVRGGFNQTSAVFV